MSREDFRKMIEDLRFKKVSTDKWRYKYVNLNIKIEETFDCFYIYVYSTYQSSQKVPIILDRITETEFISFCRRFTDENLFKYTLRERKLADILD